MFFSLFTNDCNSDDAVKQNSDPDKEKREFRTLAGYGFFILLRSNQLDTGKDCQNRQKKDIFAAFAFALALAFFLIALFMAAAAFTFSHKKNLPIIVVTRFPGEKLSPVLQVLL